MTLVVALVVALVVVTFVVAAIVPPVTAGVALRIIVGRGRLCPASGRAD